MVGGAFEHAAEELLAAITNAKTAATRASVATRQDRAGNWLDRDELEPL